MSTPFWRRIACWAAFLLAAVPAGAQPTTTVSWLQLPPGCPENPAEIETGDGEEPQAVACGEAGRFVFGRSSLRYHGKCEILAAGSEPPAAIPAELTPHLPDTFPCLQGRCLGHRPGEPWVAVVDWANEHGWSVAATVREASDGRVGVELYDLAAAGVMAQWVASVSDLHVLVQLCALAERAHNKPADRPLAVNLSFGRRDPSAPCDGSGSSLGCSVSYVLSRLAESGIRPVAAAGNHRELLFPASSSAAISAGALDLARLQATGEPTPSTQTPAAAQALMPGYGLYLTASTGGLTYWPAPPGSSYAAALFSGWLGGYLAGGGTLPALAAGERPRWAPAATPNGLALAVDGVPLPGSELAGPRLLLERALGGIPVPSKPLPVWGILRLTGPAQTLPKYSVLYADDGNGPQPGVIICLPCRGEGNPEGAPEGMESLTIDLSSSGGLPASLELLGVWVRVGALVYAFEESRGTELLASITAGEVQAFTLADLGGILAPGEQPSLVFVFHVEGRPDGDNYWHEVPIHLR
jgi:hypothetical protein